jgi:hypothetical protein
MCEVLSWAQGAKWGLRGQAGGDRKVLGGSWIFFDNGGAGRVVSLSV